jgi:Fe2+ transport system protein FeoA/rubredoxin
MAERFLTCPLCGFGFEPEDALCAHGCPLRSHCALVRCPACDYEFTEQPRRGAWLRRLLGGTPPASSEGQCEALSVDQLAAGQTASVLSLSGSRNRLAVFGLVPGTEITLLQRRPACVVQVGETELALDLEIARRILVQRPAGASGKPRGPSPSSAEGPSVGR